MMAAIASPIDMEVFENAIHSWFSENTGLNTIWSKQSAPQPDYPYASLNLLNPPIPAAPQWDYRTDTDLTRPVGEEVREWVTIPCHITISCQSFVGKPDASNPREDAFFYMNKAQSSLSLPSVQALLAALGIAVVRPEAVQNIGALMQDAFVSRANMDVVFGAALSLEEYTGYIEKVHATSVSLGIDQVFGVL